jgi:kinesin family protein 6/9
MMGIVPRAIQYVYDTLDENPDDPLEISISYLEIYNNVAYDLLTQISGTQMQRLEQLRKVTIAENGRETLFKDLAVTRAPTLEDAHRLFWSGECLRQKAETVNNKYSSRSHTVFTIYFSRRTSSSVTNSRVNFVDLAGSEKYETLAGEVDERKREARNINKSLHTLQAVIVSLNQKQKHVPFRDSALTRFLKDSLVGNVRTAMIAALSTKRSHLSETVSTCRFGESVASVATVSQLNQQELPPGEMIARLRAEVARLREDLARGGQSPVRSSSAISEYDGEVLKETIREFVEGDAELLDVPANQVQFCFRFMRELLNQGKNAAIRVSELQKENALLRSMVPSDGGGISKEAIYIKFRNSHDYGRTVEELRARLKETCELARELNDELPVLRGRLDELEADLENYDRELERFPDRIDEAEGKAETARLRADQEAMAARQEKCASELSELEATWKWKLQSLDARKEEIVALQRELNSQRAQISQDFEEFWTNSMTKNGLAKPVESPRPSKPKQKVYATLGPAARIPPK